jgi:hypothetical protein
VATIVSRGLRTELTGRGRLHTPQTSFIYGLTTCLLLNLHVVKSLEQMGFSTSRSLEISIDQIYYGGRYLAKKKQGTFATN